MVAEGVQNTEDKKSTGRSDGRYCKQAFWNVENKASRFNQEPPSQRSQQ